MYRDLAESINESIRGKELTSDHKLHYVPATNRDQHYSLLLHGPQAMRKHVMGLLEEWEVPCEIYHSERFPGVKEVLKAQTVDLFIYHASTAVHYGIKNQEEEAREIGARHSRIPLILRSEVLDYMPTGASEQIKQQVGDEFIDDLESALKELQKIH